MVVVMAEQASANSTLGARQSPAKVAVDAIHLACAAGRLACDAMATVRGAAEEQDRLRRATAVFQEHLAEALQAVIRESAGDEVVIEGPLQTLVVEGSLQAVLKTDTAGTREKPPARRRKRKPGGKDEPA